MFPDKMLKEFCFNGLKIKIHPDVYEPSEDTFQLLEVIKVNKKLTSWKLEQEMV